MDLPTIDAHLVQRLVADPLPRWQHLPVRPVALGGWDTRTFRLGQRLLFRLPSAACHADQARKAHRWLQRLAPLLPLRVPAPLAIGAPALSWGTFPNSWRAGPTSWNGAERPGPVSRPAGCL